jgi:DNA-binding transcriptional ArsR family regulator
MSRSRSGWGRGHGAAGQRTHLAIPAAAIFAALGDRTRLVLLTKLSSGRPHSISQLARGSKLTRQAITKHLRTMEDAGIIHGVRKGRENLFALDPAPLEEVKSYLDGVSAQWDQALARLKAFVEN